MPQAMPRRSRMMLLLLAFCCALPAQAQVAPPAQAQVAPPAQAQVAPPGLAPPGRIAFAEDTDSALVRGEIRGRAVVDYVVAAEPGQRLQAELTSSNPGAFLNVRAPGAMETTHVGPVRGNVFDAEATVAGDYRLSVFLLGEAARRDEAAEYALSVTVAPRLVAATPAATPPAPAPTQPNPPAAEAALPEPEAWSITGLPRGQQLNLRAGPSTRDRVVGRLAARAVVLGRGCREVAGERWCQVERVEGGASGWVMARYLAPTTPPAAARAPERAPAPEAAPRRTGGGFDAVGFLPCAMIRGEPSRECRFGVERQGLGAALLDVLGPNGVTRRIAFERGAPVRADGSGTLTFEHFGALFLIRVGDERFEVPEAVLTGG